MPNVDIVLFKFFFYFYGSTELQMVFLSLKYYKNTSEEETCKQSEHEH